VASTFWERVAADSRQVPSDRPLVELTSELTSMLGAPDPATREGVGVEVLAAWIRGGVYDDLLRGLGDGMSAGLVVGIGDDGTDSVFRRVCSARVLTACVARDNRLGSLRADTVLAWGDRIAAWYVRERDLRAGVPGKGSASAVAHGADGVAELARSPCVTPPELAVLLEVLADRLLAPTSYRFGLGEVDRIATAAMSILRRDLLEPDVLEPWLARLAARQRPGADAREDTATRAVSANLQTFLRAMHLQLALSPDPPASRPDLLLTVIDHLRTTNPESLGPGPTGARRTNR
jgi:hypothetical protein